MTSDNLYSMLPIQSIEGNKMVNGKGVISIAYSVRFPEAFTLDVKGYNDFFEKLRNSLRLLPDYTTTQALLFYDQEYYEADFNKVSNFIQKSNALYYDKRAIPTEDSYIIISFMDNTLPESFKESTLTYSYSYLFSNPFPEVEKRLQEVESHIKNAEIVMFSLFDEYQIERSDNQGLKNLLHTYFSLDYYKEKEVANFKLPDFDARNNSIGNETIGVLSLYQGNISRSCIVPKVVSISSVQSELECENNYGEIEQSQMFPLGVGLPFKHALSVQIQKLPIDAVNKKFDVFAKGGLNLAANVGIPAAVTKREHIENFKNLINNHNYVPCNLAMALIIPEKDKTLLDIKMETTKNKVSEIFEMKAIPEHTETMLQFMAHSPGNPNQSYKSELTTLNHAVSYIPKESYTKGDKSGFRYVDRFGKPFLLNVWNSPHITNRNGIVVGPSGRGKSFLLNDLVENLLNMGAHVMVIDKGHSYKKLATVYDGTYFDSSDESKFRFNIFITEKNKNGKYILDGMQINFVSSVIVNIWKEGNPISPEEKTILSEIIEQYYDYLNDNEVFPGVTDFYNFIENNLERFPDKQKNYFDFNSLLLMLKTYAIGKDKLLLNSEDNIDLTHVKFAIFEMQAIEHDQRKFDLFCLIITFLTMRKTSRLPKSVPKSLIIDEALSFLKGDIGDFIGDLYATYRKENGQVLVVAQGLSFILEASSEVLKKIFANRDIIYLTNHEGYESSFDEYKELLSFDDQDLKLLKNVKLYKEIFLRLSSRSQILRLEKSPVEQAVYTSTPTEVAQIEKLEERTGSLEKAINKYLN